MAIEGKMTVRELIAELSKLDGCADQHCANAPNIRY